MPAERELPGVVEHQPLRVVQGIQPIVQDHRNIVCKTLIRIADLTCRPNGVRSSNPKGPAPGICTLELQSMGKLHANGCLDAVEKITTIRGLKSKGIGKPQLRSTQCRCRLPSSS